jgi:hypothetical protein
MARLAVGQGATGCGVLHTMGWLFDAFYGVASAGLMLPCSGSHIVCYDHCDIDWLVSAHAPCPQFWVQHGKQHEIE